VAAKVLRLELRMAIQSQRTVDKPVEVADQKIGQIECSGFNSGQSRECRAAGKEFIAVRARQAVYAVFGEQIIQQATRSAIPIGDEYRLIVEPVLLDFRPYRIRYLARRVMQLGSQTGHADVRPPVEAYESRKLARQRAARNYQDVFFHRASI